MVLLALLLKPVIWLVVFRSAIKGTSNAMLLRAAGVTGVLTLVDKVSVASNLAPPAILLTLILYGAMSFTLLPLAWKVKNTVFSTALNVAGVVGAFAGVNFTLDVIRGFLPFVNR